MPVLPFVMISKLTEFWKLYDGLLPFGTISKFTLSFDNSKRTKGFVKSNSNVSDCLKLSNKFSKLKVFCEDSYEFQPSVEQHRGENRCCGKYEKIKNVFSFKSKPKNLSRALNFVMKDDRMHSVSPCSISDNEKLVESGIENMFILESVGIPKTFSNADNEIIKEFEKNISMENNIMLFFHGKRNLLIKLKVILKLLKLLQLMSRKEMIKEGYLKDYLNIFEEFEQLGISINFNDIDEKEHVWIPHRPVIKEDPLVKTTKIRPYLIVV